MTNARPCRIVFVALALLATTALMGAEPARVEIEGLKITVKPKSVVHARVRNISTQRIEINVAVEKLVENQWVEILASITDSKRPYGKTVRLSPVEVGAVLPVSFMPFRKYVGISPLKPSATPSSLRLRVDVYGPHGGKILSTVWSPAFTVSALAVPPVSTISYRLDTASHAHRGVPTPHWHLYVMQQNSTTCICEWVQSKDNQGGFGPGTPSSGTIPIGPAGRGGRP